MRIVRAACHFCHGNCGVLVYVEKGRVVKVEGDRKNPFSKGYICERAEHAVKWLYHPQQLKYPLKRVGERGESRWKQVTWKEALDEIAEKLEELREKYGPECLAFCEGTYRSDQVWARARFASLFGNPQNVIDPGTICFCCDRAVDKAICGYPLNFTAELDKSNCVVLWGTRPTVEREYDHSWRLFEERLIKGKPKPKLIVIDPRLTEESRYADFWLKIRPGTDAALALAWINVIIEDRLYDEEFVTRWCYGFDKLQKHVKKYTPSWASKLTWISEEDIIESARVFATVKPACIHAPEVAVDQTPNFSATEHARMILRAITGNIDVPGGHYCFPGSGPRVNGKLLPQTSELELADKVPLERRRKQLGADRFKLMTWPGWEILNEIHQRWWGAPYPLVWSLITPAPLLWRAILTGKPYPIKALITWFSNPMLWAPNTKLVYKALKSPNLELHVVLEYFMTPTAALADYVLPAASWLERPMCSTICGHRPFVRGGARAIKPIGERRTDFEFWRELGVRLGQKEYWPWKTYEEFIEWRLKQVGISYEDFCRRPWIPPDEKKYRKYEEKGFPTPTGKVELYSTIFERLGYDPLPNYREPPESPYSTPEVAREYPLILITGTRFKPMFHSEFRQVGTGLREMHPDPIAEINTNTARRLGIRDGDWIWIETRRGRIKHKARITDGIDPRVVSIQHGWWFPEENPEDPILYRVFECNANMLTLEEPEICDPLIGNWCNRGLLCRVYKINKPE